MFPADFVENRCESKGNQTKAGQRIDNDTDIGQRRHRFAGDIFENIVFGLITTLHSNRISVGIKFIKSADLALLGVTVCIGINFLIFTFTGACIIRSQRTTFSS